MTYRIFSLVVIVCLFGFGLVVRDLPTHMAQTSAQQAETAASTTLPLNPQAASVTAGAMATAEAEPSGIPTGIMVTDTASVQASGTPTRGFKPAITGTAGVQTSKTSIRSAPASATRLVTAWVIYYLTETPTAASKSAAPTGTPDAAMTPFRGNVDLSTPTATCTPTRTATRTLPPTASRTSRRTETPTGTLDATSTMTRTATATGTSDGASTWTTTLTATPTRTKTLTTTPTDTSDATRTPSQTMTHSASRTMTPTLTPTRTKTLTTTPTGTSYATRRMMALALTPTLTPTPSMTSTLTPSPTPVAFWTGQIPAVTCCNNTGVYVSVGDTVTITASGTWSNGHVYTGGPDGLPFAQRPDIGYPLNTDSLIGRIGGNAWFEVGHFVSFVSSYTGYLYLSMNDNPAIFGDNSGALNVTAGVKPGLTVQVALSGTPGKNGWYVSPVTYTVTATSVGSITSLQARLDGGPFGGVLTGTVSGQGSHTVAWTATDSQGQTASGSQDFKIDSLPPVLNVVIPPPNAKGWYTALPVALTASASDAGSGLASLTTILDGASSLGSKLSISSDGMYQVSWLATDNAGNTQRANATIQVDSVPPTGSISLSAPNGANGWYVSDVPFTLNVSDATSGIASLAYALDGAAWTSAAGGNITTSGLHTLNWRAVDKAGNVATGAPLSIKVDKAGPSIVVRCGTPANATCTLSASAVSGIQKLTYSLDVAPPQPYTGPLALPGGSHTLSWSATSYSGQTVTGSQKILTDTTPPAFQVTSCPKGPFLAGSTVAFTGAGSDDYTGVAAWTVSIAGPVATTNSGSGAGIWANLYNAQPGTYTFSVSETDGAGNTASFSNVCQAPVVPAPPVPATQGSVSATATGLFTPYIILYTPTSTRPSERWDTPVGTTGRTLTRTPTATPTDTSQSTATPMGSEPYSDGYVGSDPIGLDATPGRGPITALVYEDTSGNGRCDKGDPGVAGQPFDVIDADGQVIGHLTSEALGRLTIDDSTVHLRYTGDRPVSVWVELDAAVPDLACPQGLPVLGLLPPTSHDASLLALALWLLLLPGCLLALLDRGGSARAVERLWRLRQAGLRQRDTLDRYSKEK